MIHYKLVKIIIDVSHLVKIINNIVVRHYSLLDSIVTNRRSFFTLKFWSLLCLSLALSGYFLLPSTHKQMARLRGKIVQWKFTFKLLSTLSKMIRYDFVLWRSLPITIPKMPAPVIYLLNSITNIIYASFTKKT